jgi:hypothetical protein
MRHKTILGFTLLAGSLLLAACGGSGGGGATGATESSTAQSANGPAFPGDSTTITNPYLPITKFHRCILSGTDGGAPQRIVRTLLSKTRPITYSGGTVKAAVVQDRVTQRGSLIEQTFDYFAQDQGGTVYYLGEDVSEYKNGKVTSHEGQWLLGRDTETPGVLMPANPKVADTFKSEDVPGITHETDTVVSAGKTERIGAHTYRRVIRVRENAGPPPEVEYKTYSPGTGVLTEANGGMHIVSCS